MSAVLKFIQSVIGQMGNTGSSVDVVRARIDEDQGKGEWQRTAKERLPQAALHTANKGRSTTSSITYSELKAGQPHATIHTAS